MLSFFSANASIQNFNIIFEFPKSGDMSIYLQKSLHHVWWLQWQNRAISSSLTLRSHKYVTEIKLLLKSLSVPKNMYLKLNCYYSSLLLFFCYLDYYSRPFNSLWCCLPCRSFPTDFRCFCCFLLVRIFNSSASKSEKYMWKNTDKSKSQNYTYKKSPLASNIPSSISEGSSSPLVDCGSVLVLGLYTKLLALRRETAQIRSGLADLRGPDSISSASYFRSASFAANEEYTAWINPIN